jgi:two-component system sensor histidine kinase YesM
MVAYTQILATNSDLHHIVYYVDDKFIATGADTLFRKLSSVQSTNWGKKVYANNGESTWVLRNEDGIGKTERYLALAKQLWNPRDYRQPAGIVTLNVDRKQLEQNLTKTEPSQLVYIESGDGDLVASSGDTELATMHLPKPIDTYGAFKQITLKSGTYMARGQKIGDTNLYLVSVISYRATSEALGNIRNQMATVYMIVCMMLLIFIFPVTRSITHRIFQLMNKMSQVRQGRLNQLEEGRGWPASFELQLYDQQRTRADGRAVQARTREERGGAQGAAVAD